MHEEIIFAGFGGQGIITAGKLLCIAALLKNHHVSHIPSYGAEMRGGTANCSVVISTEEIASPIVTEPSVALVLNEPSMDKFEPKVKKGGILIYNSSLIKKKPVRDDITVIALTANDFSEKHGSVRAANMAALGALIKLKPELASLKDLEEALYIGISERNHKHNPVNVKVMKEAYNSL